VSLERGDGKELEASNRKNSGATGYCAAAAAGESGEEATSRGELQAEPRRTWGTGKRKRRSVRT